MIKDDIVATGAKHVSEVREINKELIEKALRMRCLAYLSQVKSKLLTDTIVDMKLSKGQLARELTERKEMEAALKEAKKQAEDANAAKSEFLSSMSHELRTPLNSIIGFSQLLLTDTKDSLPESHKESVKMILKAGEHLLELINEVLNLAKIESGKIQISMEAVEVAPVIKELLDAVEPIAKKRKIKTINGIKAPGQFIRADRTRLKQVLMNLLSNAVKYNRDGGTISVWLDDPGTKMWRLCVEDTGPGIAKENLHSLFEPFYRLEKEKPNIEGTGIGLAITKKLVNQMRGSIKVESAVTKGTKFFVELEKSDPPEFETEEAGEKKNDQISLSIMAKRTILYVEDNPANLKLMVSILKRRPNLELLTAHEAQIGIDIALAHLSDLILMDINLPGINGVEALKNLQVHDETRNIPVVAISANAMPTEIEKVKALGFREYITKPINVARFLEVLDNILKA